MKTAAIFRAYKSKSTTLSLDKVISCLKSNKRVDAVLIAGSAGSRKLKLHSDYDLVIVLAKGTLKISSTFTYVDRRPTDIFYYLANDIDRLIKTKKIRKDKEIWLVAWIRKGLIAVDKHGRLKALKAKGLRAFTTPFDAYSSWFKINYNFAQNLRHFNSKNQIYLAALDVRLLYSTVEAFVGYFNLRSIPWQGEKHAIQYLRAHNPKYLALFKQCVANQNGKRKFLNYEKLVRATFPSAKNQWPHDIAVNMPSSPNNLPKQPSQTTDAFWNSLLR